MPLLRSEITGPIAVSVRAGKNQIPWTQGEQIALRAAQTGTDHMTAGQRTAGVRRVWRRRAGARSGMISRAST